MRWFISKIPFYSHAPTKLLKAFPQCQLINLSLYRRKIQSFLPDTSFTFREENKSVTAEVSYHSLVVKCQWIREFNISVILIFCNNFKISNIFLSCADIITDSAPSLTYSVELCMGDLSVHFLDGKVWTLEEFKTSQSNKFLMDCKILFSLPVLFLRRVWLTRLFLPYSSWMSNFTASGHVLRHLFLVFWLLVMFLLINLFSGVYFIS